MCMHYLVVPGIVAAEVTRYDGISPAVLAARTKLTAFFLGIEAHENTGQTLHLHVPL